MQQFLCLLSVKHFPNHHVPAKAKANCNVTWQLHIALFGRAGSLGMTWTWTVTPRFRRSRSEWPYEPQNMNNDPRRGNAIIAVREERARIGGVEAVRQTYVAATNEGSV